DPRVVVLAGGLRAARLGLRRRHVPEHPAPRSPRKCGVRVCRCGARTSSVTSAPERTGSVGAVLELDHVFFVVGDPEDAVARLEGEGWALDEGQAHAGQGTRNRRLIWPGLFFEILWVIDAEELRGNVLRLDRRAGWRASGASPVGLAFRGQVEPAGFWLYDA